MILKKMYLPNEKHEFIYHLSDKKIGLEGFIAIHSTVRGPAIGGTRILRYTVKGGNNSVEAIQKRALNDVLRLSRGMTKKTSAARIGYGGGKAVLVASPEMKTLDFWEAYGNAINELNGMFLTAEDSGTNTDDMAKLAKTTKYVSGLRSTNGDPSPKTALGIFKTMKVAAKECFGSEELKGKTIMVQGGGGHVGQYLIKHLVEAEMKVLFTELSETNAKMILDKYGDKVTRVEADEIFKVNFEIFAPCAIGGIINPNSIKKLKKLGCRLIHGAANNQLEDGRTDSILLQEAGILYSNDYIINSGGVIDCVEGFNPNYDYNKVMNEIDQIPARLQLMFDRAKQNKTTTFEEGEKFVLAGLASLQNVKVI